MKGHFKDWIVNHRVVSVRLQSVTQNISSIDKQKKKMIFEYSDMVVKSQT